MLKRKSTALKLFFGFLALLAFFGLAHPSWAFTQGETKTFNISSTFDSAGRSQIKATLRFFGDKAVFFVDDDYWEKLSDREAVTQSALGLLKEFDQTIYPGLTRIFGSEWSPGIDSESRIAVLIFKMKDNAGGYFDNTDEFPKSVLPLSNENELIYLNSSFLNTPKIKVYLAHEFQHLITFYQKERLRNVVDDVWLNEARSEYTSTLLGYDDNFAGSNLEKRTKEFLQNSSNSMTEWKDENADYGPVNLFMQYFVSRYGQSVLSKMMKNELAGIPSIDQSLAESGFNEKFNDIFLNWALANFSNNCLLGESQKYCYFNTNLSDLKMAPVLNNILPADKNFSFSFSDSLKDWSLHGYKISGGGSDSDLTISFSGSAAAKFKIAALVNKANGEKYVKFFDLSVSNKVSEIFSNFGREIKDMILIPFSQGKTTGFSANEPVYSFSYSLKLTGNEETSSSVVPVVSPPDQSLPVISPSPLPSPEKISSSPKEEKKESAGSFDSFLLPLSLDFKPSYSDGSLIRAKNDFKVYILKGKFKRWLQAPEILSMYPHFLWQNVVETSVFEKNWYQDAWLARVEGEERIYEINGDGTKHWLNMSAEDFLNSGRNREMVYEINKKELEWYKAGADVLK